LFYNWAWLISWQIALFGLIDIWLVEDTDWKNKARMAGSLSFWELTRKASNIREKLENGITEISLRRSECEECLRNGAKNEVPLDLHSDYETSLITQVYALTASVLLEVSVSGPYPGLTEVESEVSRAMQAFTNLPDANLLQSMVWPFCVTGCMAQPNQYEFFRNLFSTLNKTTIGSTSNAMKIIQRCWSLRENGQYENGVDWNDAMKSLQIDVLFV
jgi:hypothetical protein